MCQGHLECRLIETPFGEKYLITPDSVEKHIAYIDEVTPTTGRDLSGQAAASHDSTEPEKSERQAPSTSSDQSRRVATDAPDMSRYVARLESENEFLRGQVVVKDTQIKDLTERARETNHLIAGLQRMLSPLLGRGERRDAPNVLNGEEPIAPEPQGQA